MKHRKPLEALLTLKDAVITNIETDSDYRRGYCDTCDIGEEYISTIRFEFTNRNLNFKVDYTSYLVEPINQAVFVRTILSNVDRFEQMGYDEFKQFFDNLQIATDEESSEFYEEVSNI